MRRPGLPSPELRRSATDTGSPTKFPGATSLLVPPLPSATPKYLRQAVPCSRFPVLPGKVGQQVASFSLGAPGDKLPDELLTCAKFDTTPANPLAFLRLPTNLNFSTFNSIDWPGGAIITTLTSSQFLRKFKNALGISHEGDLAFPGQLQRLRSRGLTGDYRY